MTVLDERRVAVAAATRRWADRRKTEDPIAYQQRRTEIKQAWRDRNREKARAHYAVDNAIRAGRLVRPGACERCGKDCKPEASHDDYSKQLEVEWLCRKCHAAKDRRD